MDFVATRMSQGHPALPSPGDEGALVIEMDPVYLLCFGRADCHNGAEPSVLVKDPVSRLQFSQGFPSKSGGNGSIAGKGHALSRLPVQASWSDPSSGRAESRAVVPRPGCFTGIRHVLYFSWYRGVGQTRWRAHGKAGDG